MDLVLSIGTRLKPAYIKRSNGGSAHAILEPMKGGNHARGFTIVETLIVLAVSGFMLVAVAGIISNKQGESEFQQAVNSVTQKLQQAIDDVANGYHPVSNIACTATSSGPLIKSGGTIGTNSACVLVGKVIQFDSKNAQFIDYFLVDLQTGGGYYTAIAPSSGSGPSFPDSSTKVKLNGGLTIYYSGPSKSIDSSLPTWGFGLIMSNQAVDLYYISKTSASNSSTINVDAIDKPVHYNFNLIVGDSYNICLASGTTNQSGLISIGGSSGKNLAVTLTIKDGTKC